jgi:hypothetical protein
MMPLQPETKMLIAAIGTIRNRLSSLSLTLSPSTIEDPLRKVLQARADHFSNLVGLATAVVAIGVALEGVEIVHDAIAWWKRKRREKREHAELREIANIFPCGEVRGEPDLHSDHSKWIKRFLRLGLITVVIGVVGEWRCGDKLEDAHNAIHEYDLAKLTAADEKAGDAATSAKTAHDESSTALTISRGARLEANSFETDIKSAKEQATAAEAHLAEALKEAATAQAELNILRSPRSVKDIEALVSALKYFKGTEFSFSGVFMDEESRELAASITDVLQRAGWIPTASKTTGIASPAQWIRGFTGGAVGASLSNGVHIRAEAEESNDSLRAIALKDKTLLPLQVRAALALRDSLANSIVPVQNNSVAGDVAIDSPRVTAVDEHCAVLIEVGKKP